MSPAADRLLPPFGTSIPGRRPHVRRGLRQLIDGLAPLGLGPEERSTIELVIAEALNNVVEHAYPDPASAGEITIRCRHRADGLHVTITDRGRPMPDCRAPLGQPPRMDVALPDLPEGGFGWLLIRDLARDVSYLREGHRNRLELRLAIALRKD
jgi:serine/threonine-protein kinase RsbW